MLAPGPDSIFTLGRSQPHFCFGQSMFSCLRGRVASLEEWPQFGSALRTSPFVFWGETENGSSPQELGPRLSTSVTGCTSRGFLSREVVRAGSGSARCSCCTACLDLMPPRRFQGPRAQNTHLFGCGSRPMVPFWGRCTTHVTTHGHLGLCRVGHEPSPDS